MRAVLVGLVGVVGCGGGGGGGVDPCEAGCTGNTVWSDTFGDATAQQASGVAVTAAGDLLVTGQFRGDIELGGGTLMSAGTVNAFVARLSADGAFLDATWFGSEGAGIGAVDVAPGGDIVVAGNFNAPLTLGGDTFTPIGMTDLFVARLTPEGDHVWSFAFGSPELDAVNSIAVAPGGEVLVVGFTRGTIDFGSGPLTTAGNADVVVALLDPDGNHLRSRLYGGPQGDFGLDAAADASGLYVAGGVGSSGVDLGGEPTMGPGGFVIHLGLDFSERFARHLPGASAFGIDIDGVDIVVTGPFGGILDLGLPSGPFTATGQDGWLGRLDAAGVPIWAHHIGGPGDQVPFDVVRDASGELLVSGQFSEQIDLGGGPLASAGDSDRFVARLDPDGAHRWSRRFGGSMREEGAGAIAPAPGGGAFIAGGFRDAIDLGRGSVPSEGDTDGFVARLAP